VIKLEASDFANKLRLESQGFNPRKDIKSIVATKELIVVVGERQ
jgi:hypothetical protein